MTEEGTKKLIRLLWAPFPHYEIKPETTAAFQAAWHGKNYKDIYDSIVYALKTPKQFPYTPGEILEVLKSQQLRTKQAVPGITYSEDTTYKPEIVAQMKIKFPDLFK